MRMAWGIFLLAGFSINVWALTVIQDQGGVDASPWLKLQATRNNSVLSGAGEIKTPLGLPAKSHLKQGAFDSYQLDSCTTLSTSFFVVGRDEISMDWLRVHKAHLQDIHALGFVTNIETEDELRLMRDLSGMALMPVVVDELAAVLKAPSYPFFTDGCEVRQ